MPSDTTTSPASDVITSFTAYPDGNDTALMALVPATAALAKELTTAKPKKEAAATEEETTTEDTAEEVEETTTEEAAAEEEEAQTDPEEEETAAEEPEEIKALRAELAELKAAAPAVGSDIVLAPSGQSPLSEFTTPAALTTLEADCQAVLDWAEENRDGGQLPLELAAKVLGKKPADITEEVVFDADQVKAMIKGAKARIRQDIPARQEFLRIESAVLADVRKSAPAVLDPKTPQGKAVARLLGICPALKNAPEWAAIARDWEAGFTARLAAAKAPKPAAGKVVDKAGKKVPLAPAASTGGTRSSAVPKSNAKIAAASERIRSGKGSEADSLLVLSVAE